MRILLANHTPLYGSGSGTYTAMLGDGLTQAGHEVCILTPFAEQSNASPSIQTYSVDLGEHFPSFTGHPLSSTTYEDLAPKNLAVLQVAWQDAFIKVRNHWKPDVVHVQHVWVVAKAAILAGFRPIVTCHGSEANFASRHPAVAEVLLPKPELLHTVINISSNVAQIASSILNGTAFRTILANPYNDQLFYYEPQRSKNINFPHLGFVGRLVAYKNCEHFLECVARMTSTFPNLKASVIGDGPHRNNLEELARRLNILEIVRFLGQVDQERLRPLYQDLNVLIVPSDNEPFGLVALEAVACGTQAIVARSGGLAELIHHPFILGYKSTDLEDLTVRVMEVITQPYKVEFGRHANDYVLGRYSLRKYVERLESIYSRQL